MAPTETLVVAQVKCVDPAEQGAWSDWYDAVHLPDLLDAGDTATVATRWVLSDPPTPGMPGLGFSHVTIYEFDDSEGVARLESRAAQLRATGRVHPSHCVTNAAVWNAHGRWNEKPDPSENLRGHIIAEVMPADPADEGEWDEWYDSVHVSDMMDSGAFAATTRWERSPRRAFGANHLTLYDVAHEDIQTAVDLSARAMPGIVAGGRKFPGHTGVLTLTLLPSGPHAGVGYRPAG